MVAPLRLIRHMSAVDSTRRRLMIIFSTSIVTTCVLGRPVPGRDHTNYVNSIVSLVHAAFIFTDAGIKVVIAAIVEVNE